MRTSKGFTLIELLVVIAIIGLLASVVLASLNTARYKGRDARRQSDMHQIQNALELYASDHNGSYPPAGSNGNWSALAALVTGGYLPSLPNDPSGTGATFVWDWINHNTYYYWAGTNGALNGGSGTGCGPFRYELWYHTEGNSNGNACQGVRMDSSSFVIQMY